jgi:hypothetical protein
LTNYIILEFKEDAQLRQNNSFKSKISVMEF